MKILGKLLFYAVVALLWVFIIAASLEGWARWRWHRIETRNPFVLSRTQHQLWPIPRIPENEFSAEVTNTELRDRYRGQGKSREQLQAVVLDPLELTGSARDQVDRIAARVAELASRHPEGAGYHPGAVL